MSANTPVRIVKRATGEVLIQAACWCSSYLSQLRGLQFRRRLEPGEALIISKAKDSVAGSSIHMFFVFFPIAAVWVNGEGRVTSAHLARPWRPYYASPEPARYVSETSPDFLDCIQVGDHLDVL